MRSWEGEIIGDVASGGRRIQTFWQAKSKVVSVRELLQHHTLRDDREMALK